MEKKSFGIALLLWFVGGAFGAHRVYVKESVFTFFWYFLAAFFTFGLLPLIDLFLIKGMIEKKYMNDKIKN